MKTKQCYSRAVMPFHDFCVTNCCELSQNQLLIDKYCSESRSEGKVKVVQIQLNRQNGIRNWEIQSINISLMGIRTVIWSFDNSQYLYLEYFPIFLLEYLLLPFSCHKVWAHGRALLNSLQSPWTFRPVARFRMLFLNFFLVHLNYSS